MACQNVDWIYLARDKGEGWAAVDVDPNLRVA
jgi:hypothetical protein